MTIGDVWYSSGLGIEEDTTPNTEPFSPNATIVHNILNLQSEISNLQSEIALLDAAGRKVIDLHPGQNDIRSLAPGVYFVVAGGSEPLVIRKVVVTK